MINETYGIDQLTAAGMDYFDDDSLATSVWVNKYALKENGLHIEPSPKETIERISKEIHRAEQNYPNSLSYDDIHSNLEGFGNFIFGGSILFGLGNPHQMSSLGNCFFIDNGADSYGGIFNIDETMAQLMKRRGGVGVTIENLRPTASSVNNSAQSSTGAPSFMSRYSGTTREVAQDGRRGALMISMNINHPDSPAFIVAKSDLSKITGANVSLKITDEFMRAVESDEDYILHWPTTLRQPKIDLQLTYNVLHKLEDGTYVKRVKAKELWDELISQAHKNAEPGVLFWDSIINESPADCYADLGFETKGTNPCISGDTLIAVADGRNAVSIKQLVKDGKDVPVYSTNTTTGKTEIKLARNPRLTKKNTEVWKLKLDDNSELIATPDHMILTSNLEYKELKDLSPGESIIPFYSFISNGYRQISRTGVKMSGGNFRNKRQYRLIEEFHNGDIDAGKYHIHHKDFDSTNDSIGNLQRMLVEDHKELHATMMRGKKNPYHKMSKVWKKNFASHPGESNGRYSGWSNKELLNLGKDIFLLEGKLTRNIWYSYAKKVGAPLRLSNEFRFGSFTNFKNQIAENHKVSSISFHGYDDVYNITVDDNHNYHIINSFEDDKFIKSSGVCIKNCGEVPLSPFDSCRLGSVNLAVHVLNAYKKNSKMDWQKLEKTARFAQRVMDDIVSLEEEKVKAIIKKIKSDPEPKHLKRVELETWEKVLDVLLKGRRTGIGALGLGDMLAKLGIQYGSAKATKLIDKIFETIAISCYKETVQLAKERGAFPIWDLDKEANNPFLTRVIANNFSNEEYKEYTIFGRRNIALLSIAPTGSLAIEARTSSGIEPVFKVRSLRRKKINPNEPDVRVDFVDDNGDSWQEYNVFHHEFIVWFRQSKLYIKLSDANTYLNDLSETDLDAIIEQSPWAGSESHDIDYLEKVRMQGVIQKWIDHSISVTHNLPEHITKEEVNKIYFKAWKHGCKGCTIYR
jgi:ribonucleotide reductase alpha subunit